MPNIGDPLGIYRMQRETRRCLKVHAHTHGLPICDVQRLRPRLTDNDENVTCLRCLYYMGLYVPFERLKEHQYFQHLRVKRAVGAPYA